MNKFLLKLLLFTLSICSLLLFIFWNKNHSFDLRYERFQPTVFNQKLDKFSNFIKKRKNINLVLGSSAIEHSIIPNILGNDWFSFSHGGQNIYESYKSELDKEQLAFLMDWI